MVFVDQGLIRFGKFAGALLGVFLVVGAALYGYDAQNAHKQAVEAQSAAQIAQNEAQKAQNAAQKSALDMQQWLAEQQKTIGSRTTLVDHQIEALRLKIVQIFGRNIDISADIPDADGDSLINLARSGQGIQANVDALENRLSNLEFSVRQASRLGLELSVETLDTLSRTLRVRQISSSVQGPTDVRKSYDLSFSLCVQDSDKCEQQGLDAVEKVIYRLDPRWFSSANETRISRADQFSFGVRVWGITKVAACIYLKGRAQPVVRAGLMSLTEAQYWGPDSSVTPEVCAS